ncbi:glycosylated lysosomal membrane protein [Octopus bimaculoides]|uniref:Lysosomal protein NCU-G1 n=1 Tax=Octopus bimaculoides TaxID=37653 RepID=A0A0L8G2Y1_OCTBM|nr:glycosylated lysosomal membrane protein [Octopus bimaculoides]|eukprot:XP_014784683.1 PREDICTED: glycosylated lysosomal membrane protein-like [Octopus bimaculoides]
MVSKLHFCLLATVCCFFSLVVFCHSRKISTDMNWGKSCPKNVTLVYTKAVGNDDTLHYIYSSAELMSLLAIKTVNDAKLKLSCSEMPPSVTLESPTSEIYSFGIIFNQIIAYNDSSDSANLLGSNYTEWQNYSTGDMIWKISQNKTKPNENLVVLESFRGNGSFQFAFQVSDDVRQTQLPHLQLNDNLTLVGFSADGVPADFVNSRFALNATYISSYQSKFDINSVKSLDDEYTPGVFKVTTWSSHKKSYHSFMQWKSVCYLTNKYERKDSSSVQVYDLRNSTAGAVNESVAFKFFKMRHDISMKSTYISFGLANDEKYYNTTQFTSWFFITGFGEAPVEKISVAAIIIIAVGLGLPVLLIILGGAFLCWKKRRSDYTPVYGTIST